MFVGAIMDILVVSLFPPHIMTELDFWGLSWKGRGIKDGVPDLFSRVGLSH
jgi:hypothetical protein